VVQLNQRAKLMYRTPCVNKCMKYFCYDVLHANRTVSLQLVMNVLLWIVLSHHIYRVTAVCL